MWYVCCHSPAPFLRLITATGLYYKLHGSHRPVAMKKATIKRRKRVVPAYPDVAPQTDSPTMQGRGSASPDSPSLPPSHLPEQSQNTHRPDPQLPPIRQSPTLHFTRSKPRPPRPPPVR